MIRFLYRFVHNLVVWTAPILLVLTSIVLAIPQTQMHKTTLASNGFYADLSQQLNPDNSTDYQLSLQSIVLRSVFKGLASDSWLQGVFEKNVDQLVGWLEGDNNNLELYIPNKEIEDNIKNNIDSEVKTLVEQKGSQIKPCGGIEAENIKQNGFKLDTEFCLPAGVLSGDQNLLQYMGLSDSSVNQDFLDSFFRNNQLKSDTIAPTKLESNNTNFASALTYLGYIKDANLLIKNNLALIWGVFLIFVFLSILLSRFSGKTYVGQLQKLTLVIGINTLSICVFLLLIIGGSNYLTSSVSSLIFPGLVTSELNNLIILKILQLSVNFFLFALITSAVLIAIRIAISILKSTGIISGKSKKNQKINSHSQNIDQNYTHDGLFKKELSQKIPTYIPPVDEEPGATYEEVIEDNLSQYPKDQTYKYFNKPAPQDSYNNSEALNFADPNTFQTNSHSNTDPEVESYNYNTYPNPPVQNQSNTAFDDYSFPQQTQNPYIEMDRSGEINRASYYKQVPIQGDSQPLIEPNNNQSNHTQSVKVKIAVENPVNPSPEQTPPKKIIGL